MADGVDVYKIKIRSSNRRVKNVIKTATANFVFGSVTHAGSVAAASIALT